MAARLFVPLITVDIECAPNAERPAIDKTTRTCQCPPYEIALIRKRWGQHAASITDKEMIAGVNPLYELVGRMGKTPIETEEIRLTEKYGKGVFDAVFRVGQLAEAIKECASDANAYLEEANAAAIDRAAEAGEKAAAALIKESQKAVQDAFAKRDATTVKRVGRPRKEVAPTA